MRPPAVAGSFYPAAAPALRARVATLLADAAGRAGAPRGIIAPHAGYAYSGAVAAEAFAAVGGLAGLSRALVIGPSHFARFPGLAAPSSEAFLTPLGAVPVDAGAVRSLARAGLASIDDLPHAPEHAIEVELPFLQAVFGDLPVIPLLFGAANAAAVAEAIARAWTEDTLLVVSTDLSHFEPAAAARLHDARTAEAIERLDEAAIGPRDACGHLAVRGALIEARRRGLTARRLALRNSADAAGDITRVVGYGAWTLA